MSMDMNECVENLKKEFDRTPTSTKINAVATILEVVGMIFWFKESMNGVKHEEDK